MQHSVYFCLLLISLAFANAGAAQLPPSINIDWKNKEVNINSNVFSKQSSLKHIRQALGSEDRSLFETDNPTRSYIYDNLGICFIVDTVADILRKIDIYCAKGRKEFDTSPKLLFTGRFAVNEQQIHFTDSIAAISEKTKLPFEEMGPGFYWYTVDNEEFSLTIAYASKRKETISMMYILFDTVDE